MKIHLIVVLLLCLIPNLTFALDVDADRVALDLIKSEKVEDLDANVQEQLRAIGHKSRQIEKIDPGASTAVATKSLSKEVLAESEIPVLSDEKLSRVPASESLSNKLILSFTLVFGLLAGGLLFLRRYMQKNREKTKHTQIKVLTQHFLGPKKSLAIIRVAGESVLIGITDHSISLIKQLHMLDEEIQDENEDHVFSKKLKSQPQPVQSESDESWIDEEDQDEFSVKNIREVLSKGLRKSRTF